MVPYLLNLNCEKCDVQYKLVIWISKHRIYSYIIIILYLTTLHGRAHYMYILHFKVSNPWTLSNI